MGSIYLLHIHFIPSIYFTSTSLHLFTTHHSFSLLHITPSLYYTSLLLFTTHHSFSLLYFTPTSITLLHITSITLLHITSITLLHTYLYYFTSHLPLLLYFTSLIYYTPPHLFTTQHNTKEHNTTQ